MRRQKRKALEIGVKALLTKPMLRRKIEVWVERAA
jgi:hypothetical protein